MNTLAAAAAAPPYSFTAAILQAGALFGTTIYAGIPLKLAAKASAAAWLPELQHHKRYMQHCATVGMW